MEQIFFASLEIIGMISIVMTLIAVYFWRRQNKFIKTLNEGDTVYYNGKEAQIVRKSDGTFDITLCTNGMDLAKFKKKKVK